MKICCKCWVKKPLSAFYVAGNSSDGRRSRCRDCEIAVKRDKGVRPLSGPLVVRCNRAVAKRQSKNTHVCWSDDYPAHRATAHMLDEIGRVLPTYSITQFRAVFTSVRDNKVEKAKRVADEIAQRRAEDALQREVRMATKVAEKAKRLDGRKSDRKFLVENDLFDDTFIEAVLWERLRSHMKKQRRRKKGCYLSLVKRGLGIDGAMRKTLGYGIGDLRQSIESQFAPWMSWSLLLTGQIHIDHIIPASAFDLTDPDECKACYGIENLQPLGAIDNIKKSNRHVAFDKSR